MLKVLNASTERTPPLHLATASPVEFRRGFHEEEVGPHGAFRWMRREGTLAFAPTTGARSLELCAYRAGFGLPRRLYRASRGWVRRLGLTGS